jgi:AraC-like DNA-binding protein
MRKAFRLTSRLPAALQERPPARALSRTSQQLEPGHMRVASRVRRLAGLVVEESAADRTAIHGIRPAPQCELLLLGAMRPGKLFVDGHELSGNCCVMVDEGAEVELIAHAHSPWLAISLSAGSVANLPLLSTRRSLVLRAGVRLARLARQAPLPVEEDGALARALHVLQCTEEEVADAAAALPANDKRMRRRLAIERAREYIRGHLADRIRLADLCVHAQLRARSLEYGFQELARLSPVGYVRMLRLGEVRRLLLDGAAQTRNISAIALDSGFSHVSQFVVDYKRVYGETPSTTRRNARGSAFTLHRPEPAPRRLLPWLPRHAQYAHAPSGSASA